MKEDSIYHVFFTAGDGFPASMTFTATDDLQQATDKAHYILADVINLKIVQVIRG